MLDVSAQLAREPDNVVVGLGWVSGFRVLVRTKLPESGSNGFIACIVGHGNRVREMNVAKDDWSFTGMRRRMEALRRRTDAARASALKVDQMPGRAVTAVAVAGRAKVQDLTRSLMRMGKWLDEDGAASSASQSESTSEAKPRKTKGRATADISS